jgi:hypothetical protein
MMRYLPAALPAALTLAAAFAAPQQKYAGDIDINPPPIASDKSVRYDYDIVYVRAPRRDPTGRSRWAEVGDPRTMEPGADLVQLHPDGKEEVLVPAEGNESVADPQVSFDGKWVYFAKFHDALNHKGADIYKIHVPTRKVVRLTRQSFTPNAGAADWSKTPLPAWGVYNTGPCPLPGGRLAFVSDRNAFKATNPGYAPNALALQLFVMDDDGKNVECIGHLNLGSALHPDRLLRGGQGPHRSQGVRHVEQLGRARRRRRPVPQRRHPRDPHPAARADHRDRRPAGPLQPRPRADTYPRRVSGAQIQG